MTTTERDQIRSALQRVIDRSPDLGPTPTVDVVEAVEPPRARKPWLPVSAAAAVVIAIGAVAVIGDDTSQRADRPEPTSVADESLAQHGQLSATVVPIEPAPRPDLYPTLPESDPRNDNAVGNYSQSALGNPQRVSALVARRDQDRLVAGVEIAVVAAVSGSELEGRPTEVVTIDGIDVEVRTDSGSPSVTTVVISEDPLVIATGLDPVSLLTDSGLDLVSATDDAGRPNLTIDTDRLPDGYEVVVEPAPFAVPGAVDTRTALGGGASAADGATVTMTLDNPLISAATVGDLRAADVNGAVAWIATNPGHAVMWQVSETTWARVVGNATPQASLDIARDLVFVDEAAWRDRYDVTELLFDGQHAFEIDRGNEHGIAVGQAVIDSGGLVGRVTSVTDTSSRAIGLADPRFSAAATIQPTAVGQERDARICSVRGRHDHVALYCDSDLDEQDDIGAAVTTSGVDSLLPAGIPIGTITAIGDDTDGQQRALIEPNNSNTIGDRVTIITPN